MPFHVSICIAINEHISYEHIWLVPLVQPDTVSDHMLAHCVMKGKPLLFQMTMVFINLYTAKFMNKAFGKGNL